MATQPPTLRRSAADIEVRRFKQRVAVRLHLGDALRLVLVHEDDGTDEGGIGSEALDGQDVEYQSRRLPKRPTLARCG